MSNHSANITCNPVKNYATVYFAIIPAIQVVINGFCAVAAFRSRTKLRSNYVYAYVLSNLAANIVFGLFSSYSIVNRGLAIESISTRNEMHRIYHSNPLDRTLEAWWAFRSSFAISLFLIMSGSISSLIYGLRESAYFVGPIAGSSQRPNVSSNNNSVSTARAIRRKRNSALVIIAVCWAVPTVLPIACATTWNCLEHCICFGGLYGFDTYICQSDRFSKCSRMHPPLTIEYLLLVVTLWCVLALIIVVMLLTTLQKYWQILKPTDFKSSGTGQHKAKVREVSTPPPIKASDGYDGVEQREEVTTAKSFFSYKRLPHFNYTIKLMLIISLLFIVCSLPAVVVMATDLTKAAHTMSATTVLASYAACMAYCVISPMLLVYYMSGLRQAVKDLLRNLCGCCTQTIVKQGSRSGISVSEV